VKPNTIFNVEHFQGVSEPVIYGNIYVLSEEYERRLQTILRNMGFLILYFHQVLSREFEQEFETDGECNSYNRNKK
jgi:hypothetical protein